MHIYHSADFEKKLFEEGHHGSVEECNVGLGIETLLVRDTPEAHVVFKQDTLFFALVLVQPRKTNMTEKMLNGI